MPLYLRGAGPPLASLDPALLAHGARVVSIGPVDVAAGAGADAPPRAAHGAAVIGIPAGPPAAMGSRRPWGAPVRAVAHGAAVMGIPVGPPAAIGSRGAWVGAARGSRSAGWRDVGAEVDREEDLGWLEVWTLARICWAAGSFSHAKREPKGKCWTTGNLERTSTLYILIMPWGVSVSVFCGGIRRGWSRLKSDV
jgi:hypothetical protein